MKRVVLWVAAGAFLLTGCKLVPDGGASGLKRFGSDAELTAYMKKINAQAQHDNEGEVAEAAADGAVGYAPPGITGSAPSEPPPTASAPETSITNNQVSGVDEGGIVKNLGRYLITLKEGRLFVADTGLRAGDPLRLTDRMNVYTSPETSADWYDEMLVSGNRILVTAYSYNAGGSEISVFTLDEAGKLKRDGRYVLESYDYFSGENYATRLVDGKLVFYAPYPLRELAGGGASKWPRLRRADDKQGGTPLFRAQDIFYGPDPDFDPVLHLVTTCSLEGELACTATGLIGSVSREMFVAKDAVYLWSSVDRKRIMPQAADVPAECPNGTILAENGDAGAVMRVPLGKGEPGMVYTQGQPINQFSFLQRADDLFILMRETPKSCAEATRMDSSMSLLRFPVAAFADELAPVAEKYYTPMPSTDGYPGHNRFVGDWLFFASDVPIGPLPEGPIRGPLPEKPFAAQLVMVPLDNPRAYRAHKLDQHVSRIDHVGNRAVIVGQKAEDAMKVRVIDPARGESWLVSETTVLGRTEAEGRSHAFSAREDQDGSALFALPTYEAPIPESAWYGEASRASISWFALSAQQALSPAGITDIARLKPARGYACEVSCIDWYGETRPIFMGNRIFGLLGTELVEGLFEKGQVVSRGRLDLTSAPAPRL